MTQVDFYVLKPQTPGDRYSLACRIAEKAWQQGRRVLIQTDSDQAAQHLDRLLWTYRDQSFVPHGRLGKVDPAVNPVLISGDGGVGDEHDVLVNVTAVIPDDFGRFARVAECVDHDPGLRVASRERFRFYRDRGYPLQTHEI